MSETVLERIERALLRSDAFNPAAETMQTAIIWPDRAQQWRSVAEALGQHRRVLTLGAFEPAVYQGPAIWLRCAVAETVDDTRIGTPILYLPGVSREELRAVEECPPELRPIAELQYRSEWFTSKGRDWTIRTLFADQEIGLGLQVADGSTTASALIDALPHLLGVPVAKLADGLLDAQRLHDIVNPDPILGLLEWIDDPAGYRGRLTSERWTAFTQQSRSQFDLDPDTDGEISGARMLGQAKGAWRSVWVRFREAPRNYPNIPERLRQARPQELFTQEPGEWPQNTEAAEDEARGELVSLAGLAPADARRRVQAAEETASLRRRTVWAELGRAPLSYALEHLGRLAELTGKPLTGGSVDQVVGAYAEWGWKADDAVVRALAAVEREDDVAAVATGITAVYQQWLHGAATTLQDLVGPMANDGKYVAGTSVASTPGAVTVFVDGLRLDIAHRLAVRLRDANLEVSVSTALAALPTVTETAKPALTPVAVGALLAGPDLHAARASGAKADVAVLRALMTEQGVQALTSGELGDPSGSAWTEAGAVDHRGHDLGVGVAQVIDAEVEAIAARVRDLLIGGWSSVEVVTDHGWLLLPGGLPKVELNVAVVEKRKGRCARLKDGAAVGVPTVPWHWDEHVRIALAPGISCFEAGKTYEHGGVSPQECVVPRLTVRTSAIPIVASAVTIESVKWTGLRCGIELTNAPEGARVDLRTSPADATTGVANYAKETYGSGRVSLVVPDEDLEGSRAYVVVVGTDGELLAQREATIGASG